MAAGITQPSGAGTTIMIYDDADTSGGRPAGPYTPAQVSAAFPVDFPDVTVNPARKKYAPLVDLQAGDGGAGRNTTTFVATKCDFDWAAGKTLKNGSGFVSPCPWHLNLGTRIDAGGRVGWKDGCNLVFGALFNSVFQLELYDSVLRQTSGVLNLTGADDPTDIQRIAGCHFQNAATGTAPSQLGALGGPLDQLFDTVLSYDTTSFCINNVSVDQSERVVVVCASPTAFIRSGAAGVALKDWRFVGSPTTSDIIWANSFATAWFLVRPIYSNSGCNKYSRVVSDIPLSAATVEAWLYDETWVDGLRNPIPSMKVRLVDAFDTVIFEELTSASGKIVFNTKGPSDSGYLIADNAVPVMDHYSLSGVYTQRHRGPFTRTVNPPLNADLSPNANYAPAYETLVETFDWPGASTVTKTSGSFEDLNAVRTLGPSAPPAPITIDDLPITAESAESILTPVGG